MSSSDFSRHSCGAQMEKKCFHGKAYCCYEALFCFLFVYHVAQAGLKLTKDLKYLTFLFLFLDC